MMKYSKNKFSLFALLCICLLMAGCSSEEKEPEADKTGTKVMYAQASFSNEDAPQTRMAYDDDLTKDYMNRKWSENDAFSVFVAGNNTTHYDFIVESPQNGTSYTADEHFKCAAFPANITDKTKLDAIYPAVTGTVNPDNITLSVEAQAQDGNKSTAHLSKCDYMTAHAVYSDATPNEVHLQFKDTDDGSAGRLGSICRINLSLPATVSRVDKIEVSSTNSSGASSLVTEVGVNIQNGTTVTSPKSNGTVTLSVTNGTTEAKDGNTSFIGYVVLFPSSVKECTVKVTTNAGVFTHQKNYETEVLYTRGQFNLMTLDLTAATPDRTSLTAYNAVGSGTAAAPYLLYTEAQLTDWATQNNAGTIAPKAASRAGNADAHFKLENDITLTAPTAEGGSNWTPIGTEANPFNGTFDGNGKVISGMAVDAPAGTTIITNGTPNGIQTGDNFGDGGRYDR